MTMQNNDYGNQLSAQIHPLNLHDQIGSQVKQVKLMVLHISEDLKCQAHIDSIVAKTNRFSHLKKKEKQV